MKDIFSVLILLLLFKNFEKKFDFDYGFFEMVQFKGGCLICECCLVYVVNNVFMDVCKGEVLCVVGESGCGKLMVVWFVVGFLILLVGEIYYGGQWIDNLFCCGMQLLCKNIQMIF